MENAVDCKNRPSLLLDLHQIRNETVRTKVALIFSFEVLSQAKIRNPPFLDTNHFFDQNNSFSITLAFNLRRHMLSFEFHLNRKENIGLSFILTLSNLVDWNAHSIYLRSLYWDIVGAYTRICALRTDNSKFYVWIFSVWAIKLSFKWALSQVVPESDNHCLRTRAQDDFFCCFYYVTEKSIINVLSTVCVCVWMKWYIIFIIYDIVELFNMHKSFSFYLNIKFFGP